MKPRPEASSPPGRKGLLHVDDWAEIRRLHRSEGRAIKAIAREPGLSRNTVRAALRSSSPPRYERRPMPSMVDAVEDRVRALLRATPTMPATVIAERLGWERGMTVLRDRVRELRPAYLPAGPAGPRHVPPGRARPVGPVVPARGHPPGTRARRATAGHRGRLGLLPPDGRPGGRPTSSYQSGSPNALVSSS